jgi:hypothetical protein
MNKIREVEKIFFFAETILHPEKTCKMTHHIKEIYMDILNFINMDYIADVICALFNDVVKNTLHVQLKVAKFSA